MFLDSTDSRTSLFILSALDIGLAVRCDAVGKKFLVSCDQPGGCVLRAVAVVVVYSARISD